MPPDFERHVRNEIGLLIGAAALRRVRQATRSRTLRASLRLTSDRGKLWLGVPHYWAVYYHDGRGPVFPRRARILIWYPNPADDPRHRGDFPVRTSQIRTLREAGVSWAQVRDDVRAGRAVVSTMTGPARSNPFFVKGLRGFFSGGGGLERVQKFRDLLREDRPQLYRRDTVTQTMSF